MFVGQRVETPYGKGAIEDIRDRGNKIVVRPSSWLLANNHPPIFYLNSKDVHPYYQVGDKVTCTFGTGEIIEIRSDGFNIVNLFNWKLANAKSPTLYLRTDSLSPLANQEVTKKDLPSIDEIVEGYLQQSLEYKAQATTLFKNKQYEEARMKYIDALNVLRLDNNDASNVLKARSFEVIIPYHNNIALCYLNMNKYKDAMSFAKNALLLIEKLESKITDGSVIWKCMVESCGMTYNKLLQWKRKSYLFIIKSQIALYEYDEAIMYLSTIIDITQQNTTSTTTTTTTTSTTTTTKDNNSTEIISDLKVFKDMFIETKKLQANSIKKEKSKWSKAFKENSNISTTTTTDTANAINTTSSTTTDMNGFAKKISNDNIIHTTASTTATKTTIKKDKSSSVQNSHMSSGSSNLYNMMINKSILPSNSTNIDNSISEEDNLSEYDTNNSNRNNSNKSSNDFNTLLKWTVGIGVIGALTTSAYILLKSKRSS